MYRIAIIRSASSAVSKNQYNIQEIGLAKELALKGMYADVFLISDRNETYIESAGFEDRVTIYWLKGIKLPGQQGVYWDLIQILNQQYYDLIQALDDSQITTVIVSMYCKRNGIPFVLWQGMYEDYPETYKKIIQYVYDRTFLKILRKNTRYAIAKTSAAARYLKGKSFVDASVIPVGLELSNFKLSQPSGVDYHAEFGLAKDRKILLYVGKVEERRKPRFCMDVYRMLRKEDEKWCLIYVGKGPLLDDVHNYVRENDIPDVIFRDQIPQEQLAPLYRMSDLFLLPTRYEIFGMVLLESMYFGTPVITYRAAGPADVIENGKDGIVLEDFDAAHWVEMIQKYERQNGGLSEMGEKAAQKISENYLWDQTAGQYHSRYIEIIRKN